MQAKGKPSGDTRLRLAIGLPLRNPEGLTNLLNALYDPASPSFRHFITPEKFTEMFGPSETDYEAVKSFARANGLNVVVEHPNRVVVDVEGTVGDIEKAFRVTIRTYPHPSEARDFYAPDADPTLDLGVRISSIGGLDNYWIPKPKMVRKTLDEVKKAKPQAGSGIYGNYMGKDFRAAYIPGVALDGSGESIGLLEFDGYFANDIAQYVREAGLPSVPLQNIPIDGFTGPPGPGNGEVALDIEVAIAMAPGLTKILVYEAPNPSPWVDLLSRMANDNRARQLSCSWGGGFPDSTADEIFQQMAAQGQSFFNASGDSDAFLNGEIIPFPADNPFITQVGGTTLTTAGPAGAWKSETVWNWGTGNPASDGIGSSGGISSSYLIPSYQQGISMTSNKGSTTLRNVPDVALTADNIYVVADNGVPEPGTGGTSAAAPLWAGFMACVNQQASLSGVSPVGFINPTIYAIGKGAAYAGDFHDISTGDNKWKRSKTQFSAVPGYDLCTGWGTPAGQNLINDLISPGVVDGILEVRITPVNGATLVEGTSQQITVQVNDVLPVANAVVSATVNGSTLAFAKGSDPSTYSASLPVPNSTNDLTLNFLITAPGKTNSTNVVTYSVIPVPANDYFSNAIKVASSGGLFLANNRAATLEKGEPVHAGDSNVAASLWWSWSPVNDTSVFIDTTGSEIDTVLAVYTGQTVSNLTQVAAANDVGTRPQAYLNFNATGGSSYRIAVASATSNSVGSIRFRVAPGGQLDTNGPTVFIASPLSGQWVSNFFLTVTGTANDPEPNASGVARVLVSLNGRLPQAANGTTNWNYTFGLTQGLNHITVGAEDFAGNPASSIASIDVTYVVLDPVNDLFANATPLSGNSGTVTVVTTNATKEYNEPNHAGNAGGKSVWWSFQSPVDGVLSLTTSNSTFDTLLGLYTGSSVSELTMIANNDDAYEGAPRGFSALSAAVHSNQTYYIAVDGFDGASGTASLGYTFAGGSLVTLTVDSAGHGQVSGSSGDEAINSTVTVKALPDPFYEFVNWTGSLLATVNPLTFVISSNVSLTANFRPITFSDDFESGNLQKLSWTGSGSRPWIVQSDTVLAGSYSARSGAITNSQTSSLVFTTNFGGGSVLFYFKVSSEPTWDFFSFLIDGVELQRWSGEVDWTSFSVPVNSGTHTLEWRYTKDPSLSQGLDAAFIDNVLLPIRVPIDATSPARLQITRQGNGSLLIVVQGQTNQQYVIQGATSLTAPIGWQNLSTNVATGGVIQYVDPATGTYPYRFYRAVVQ